MRISEHVRSLVQSIVEKASLSFIVVLEERERERERSGTDGQNHKMTIPLTFEECEERSLQLVSCFPHSVTLSLPHTNFS